MKTKPRRTNCKINYLLHVSDFWGIEGDPCNQKSKWTDCGSLFVNKCYVPICSFCSPDFHRVLIRMQAHLYATASLCWARISNEGWCHQTYLSSWSHNCSGGARLEMYGGQSSVRKLLWVGKLLQILDTSGHALSRWNVMLFSYNKGSTSGWRILSRYYPLPQPVIT